MIKFNNAYLISYISPDWDEKTKNKRMENHQKQVEWLKKEGFNIFIFAQYEGNLEGVHYFPYDKNRRYYPGDARNVCLQHFYSTDEDYCVLADDDGVIYENKISNLPFRKTIQSADLLKYNIGIISPLVPAYDPFGDFVTKYSSILDSKLIFRNRPHIGGTFMMVKNFKKHHDMQFWYKEDWKEPSGRVKYGEDAIFSMDIVKAGLGSYKLWNFALHDLGATTSTHQNKEDNTQRFRDIALEIAEMFNLRVANPGTDKQRVYYAEFGIEHGSVKEFTIDLPTDKPKGLSKFF